MRARSCTEVKVVNPGWGGQRFGSNTERRLAEVRELIAHNGKKVLLGVDGVSDVPIVLAMLGAWRFLGSRCSNRSLSYRLIHT